jgi:hypothetical protein
MKTTKGRRVWVVIHCEYMQSGRTYKKVHVDEMVFHVASSQSLAEKYVKGQGVDPFSWWKIQEFDMDQEDGEGAEYYFTHRGKPVKSPPHKSALAAWFKHHEAGGGK